METTPTKLNIEKATEKDWESILDLLKESKMDFWMDEGQDYKDFYKIEENGELICCFALLIEKNNSILRHFTIRKSLQGQGYGKKLANNLIPDFLRAQGMGTIYLLCDNKEPYTSYHFWKKTNFTVLENNAIVPKFFQDYTDKDTRENPEYVDTRYAFCLNLIP